MITGNKGEWSEIYALFKLLEEGKLYAADADLNKIESIYYPIIKIIRTECGKNWEYHPNTSVHIINAETQETITIPLDTFKKYSMLLFEKIKTLSGSFSIPEIEKFMNSIKCVKLKAPSVDKTDIKIMVHDINTGYKPILGFSIKSELGEKPTLLNSSGSTNFVYKVSGRDLKIEEINEINNINSKPKLRNRVKKIYDMGCKLEYIGMDSSIFLSNLQVIDTALPKIISEMLLAYYKGHSSNLIDLLTYIEDKNPCNFNLKHEHPFYKYKIKTLLTDVALGMKAATMWHGHYDATGGYIIVKKDGDVLCSHIYNRHEFQEYLLKNTKFESPGSTKHGYGLLFKYKESTFLKLNLQIRFK